MFKEWLTSRGWNNIERTTSFTEPRRVQGIITFIAASMIDEILSGGIFDDLISCETHPLFLFFSSVRRIRKYLYESE